MDIPKISEQLEKQYPNAKVEHFEKGVMFSEATLKHSVYLIKSGATRLYSLDKEGNEITLHLFQPETFFPMGEIVSQEYYPRFVDAFTDVEAIRLNRDEVWQFLDTNPRYYRQFTQRLLKGISGLLFKIELLKFASAYDQTIAALLLLDRYFGRNTLTGGRVIDPIITQEHIALIAAISRETANRNLKQLEKKGLLSHQDGRMYFASAEKLYAELKKDV